MKIFTFFLIALSILTISPLSWANRVFPLKPQYAFTPKGFDTNDNAQVVLAGAFSDYCMKVGSTQHRVDKIKKKIYIDQTYSTTDNCYDIEMYIPYSIEVNLGTLPEGNYDVMVLDLDHQYTKMSTLPVEKAKIINHEQSDQRLYAPVSSIEFKITKDATPQLIINGVLTNTCLSLASVEVHATMGDVFEVLPIVTDRKNNCAASFQSFTKIVPLRGFTLRNTLIHVRSMSGQSINKVITPVDRLK